ncbi:hypothetical protein F4860DRAFT_50437 [Xylaria cubensis]|nr:hypothetical protein F4860DRAFT_50437 [Xylaria cubensis]
MPNKILSACRRLHNSVFYLSSAIVFLAYTNTLRRQCCSLITPPLQRHQEQYIIKTFNSKQTCLTSLPLPLVSINCLGMSGFLAVLTCFLHSLITATANHIPI